ncbi:hypothetical protein V5O48_010173 [Marasmius crinis-equi]|uniref:Uncharacterized protein n=1 Tax=Marasmius crinis-equi TaxID=585013 RepID=A0ABR3F909_9AGAR
MELLYVLLGYLTNPFKKPQPDPLLFNGDVELWRSSMEHEFQIHNVWEKRRTEYAIEKGLEQTPDVQTAMRYRLGNYTIVSGRQVWPWTDFVHDLAEVHAEAQKLQSQSLAFTSLDLNIPGVLNEAEQVIQVGAGRFPNSLIVRGRTDVSETMAHIPTWDEIYRSIKPWLDTARHDLEHLYKDEKAKAEDVLKAIHDLIQVQTELLPGEVQYAIQEFQKFKSEHPYIVAGAEVALVVIGTEILFPAWATAFQSAWCGGRTRGLFSVLQCISMTGKMVWPIRVLTDITAAVGGTLAVMPPGEIKRLVEGWVQDTPFPIDMDMHGITVNEELEVWMKMMGDKMQEVQVPYVQWSDVAIEALRKRLEDFS